VCVSPGSLPGLLAPGLAGLESASASSATPVVDASRWDLLFADERCVPLGSDDSNHRACGAVVRALPGAAVHAIDETLADDPAAAARAYDTTVRRVCDGRLDLALLGCGHDGHTASLFPGHALYADDTCAASVVAIHDSPKPPPARVTLTRRALGRSSHIAYVATGESKAPVLARVRDSRVRRRVVLSQ